MRTLEPYWGLIETHDETFTIFRGPRLALRGVSREFAESYIHYRFDMEPGLVTLYTSDGRKSNITKRFRRRRRWTWPWKRPKLVKDYQESL